jgi:hypothetical protein
MGAVKFSHIPTSSEVGSDVTTYAGLAKRLKMLKCCHTHLVRGGLLMLQPAWEPRKSGGNSAGLSIRHPPLARWVCRKNPACTH